MKLRKIAIVLTLSLTSMVFESNVFAAVKAGSTCTKLGLTSTVSGKKFTCIKSGKKLIWDNGKNTKKPEATKPLTPISDPSSAPVPAPSPTPSPSQSAVSTLDPKYPVQGQSCVPKSGDVIGYNNRGEFVDLMCNEFDDKYFPRPANLNPFKVDPKTGKRLKGEMQPIESKITWENPVVISTRPQSPITPISELATLDKCRVPDAGTVGAMPINSQHHFVSGFGLYKERAPLTRTPVIQFIAVDFPDLPGKRTPAEDLKPVTDFLGKYWSSQTSNGTKLQFNVPNSYVRMPKNVTEYQLNVDFFSGKWTNTTSFDYVRETIKVTDATIDFSNVDVIAVVVPAEVTRQQIAAFVAESSEANRGQGFGTNEKWIYNTLIMAGPVGNPDFELLNWAHELGHNFGLTDIRNTLNVAQQDSSDLGIYDLMNSMIAPELLAWNRFIVGILNDNQVRCVTSGTSTHLIRPVEMPINEEKLVVIPTGTYKAVAIESRRAIGFDAAMGTLSEGALVYEIDTTIPYNLSPMKLIPRIGSIDTQWRRDSALKVGDSVTAQGWRISVVESGDFGDVVKVEKVG